MRPDFTTAERALFEGARYTPHSRLVIKDGAGTWQDVTALAGVDWLDEWTCADELDSYAGSGSATLRRSVGSNSLSPLMESSALNDPGSGYDPLLDIGREARIDVAITAVGGSAGSWHTLFHGRIDDVSVRGEVIELDLRGLGGRIVDADIEDRFLVMKPWAPGGYTPYTLEEAIQALLDEALGAGVVTLVVPTPTGRYLNGFWQEPGKLQDIIRTLALQSGGYDVRYRWNDSAGQFDYMLTEPDRTKTTPDATIGPDLYLAVADLSLRVDEIINVARVSWGSDNWYELENTTSSAHYGRRFRAFGQDASNARPTLADATAFATNVLSDLAEPGAEQEIENLFWPLVEIGDLYRWTANGVHYDTDRDWAVVAYEHRMSDSERRTMVRVRGTPAGAGRSWFALRGGTAAPVASVYYENYTGENLFSGPYAVTATVAWPGDFSLPYTYIEPVLSIVGGTSVVSASVQAKSSSAADTFRIAVWFTDSGSAIIGGRFIGDLMVPSAADTYVTGRIHAIPVPAGTADVHVGVEAVGTFAGTILLANPYLNYGPIAGIYVPPAAALSSSVGFTSFALAGETSTSRTYQWEVGSGVAKALVWESSALPWPATTDPTTAEYTTPSAQHSVTRPTTGVTYIQIATEDANGNRVVQQQLTYDAPASAANLPEFSAAIQAEPDVTGPSHPSHPDQSVIYVRVAVDGDAAAFPIECEVRVNDQGGTVIASNTFAAAGQIDETTDPYVVGGGLERFTTVSGGEFGWWVKLTAADGRFRWYSMVSPAVDFSGATFGLIGETQIDDDSISTPKLQANSVTAVKISVASLSAVSADLGTITAGTINGVQVNVKYGDNSITLRDEAGTIIGDISVTRYGSSPDYVYELALSVSGGGQVVLNDDPALPQVTITGGANIDQVQTTDLVFGGKSVSEGAADSGGAGYRMLVVPN